MNERMNKTTTIVSIIAVIFVLAIIGAVSAYAYGGFGQRNAYTQQKQQNDFTNERCIYHDDMMRIMQNGTFADLQAFRTQTSHNAMPWVQNASDFEQAKQSHANMRGNEAGQKCMMRRNGARGGCPMKNID